MVLDSLPNHLDCGQSGKRGQCEGLRTSLCLSQFFFSWSVYINVAAHAYGGQGAPSGAVFPFFFPLQDRFFHWPGTCQVEGEPQKPTFPTALTATPAFLHLCVGSRD